MAACIVLVCRSVFDDGDLFFFFLVLSHAHLHCRILRWSGPLRILNASVAGFANGVWTISREAAGSQSVGERGGGITT